ncbi:MAG: hypothetical protein KF724_01620 [Phycisphaeraceae bacterium]|nr:hypothetical protein [Phycisphaeraceae bacterium]
MPTTARVKPGASLLLGLALLLLPWVIRGVLQARPPEARLLITPAQVVHDGGLGWRWPIDHAPGVGRWAAWAFELPTDQGANTRSELKLFEDDRALGPMRSVHYDIRTLGGGRFSHWRKDLHFSASDSSDPRTNGREYRIESPLEISRAADLVTIALSLLGLALIWWSAPVRTATRGWRERWLSGAPRHAALQVERSTSGEGRWFGADGHPIAPLSNAWRAVLVLLWVTCAAVAVRAASHERDPYHLTTVPTTGYSDHTNGLIGYASFMDGVPRHSENMQTLDHVAMFNGSFIAADMYANRPLFPFLVSCIAWIFGVTGASLVVNLAAWAFGAWIATRVGAEVARSPIAGVTAGALACLGPGWFMHIGDYSTHLLSFTTSSLALLVVLRSQVWRARQPAEVHAAVGATLVVAALAYNSALFFATAYFILGIWRNRWWQVMLAAAAPMVTQRLWPPLLNFLSKGDFDYYEVEAGLLRNALAMWPDAWREGTAIATAWGVFIDGLVPFAAFLPLLLVGALAPLLGGVRRGTTPDVGAVLLMLMSVAMPIVAVIIYSPTATARGYLVFGGVTAAWAIIGLMLARLREGAWRGVGMGLLLLGFVAQAWFVTLHSTGDARAVKLFTWGIPDWSLESLRAWRLAPSTQVFGLCGEATPALAGGDATLRECGAYEGGEALPMLPAFRNPIQIGQMLIVRIALIAPLAIWLHLMRLTGLLWPTRGSSSARPEPSSASTPVPTLRLAGVAALLALLLVPPAAARLHRGGPVTMRHSMHDRLLPVRATQAVVEVELDPLALQQLERLLLRSLEPVEGEEPVELEVALFTGFGWKQDSGEGVIVELEVGGAIIARFDTEGVGRLARPVDTTALLAGLRRDPRLRVVATRKEGIAVVASWQRGDLPGRALFLDGARVEPSSEVPMPIVELRVRPRQRPYDPLLILY